MSDRSAIDTVQVELTDELIIRLQRQRIEALQNENAWLRAELDRVRQIANALDEYVDPDGVLR